MVLGGVISTLCLRIRYSPLNGFIPEKLKYLYYRKFKWI